MTGRRRESGESLRSIPRPESITSAEPPMPRMWVVTSPPRLALANAAILTVAALVICATRMYRDLLDFNDQTHDAFTMHVFRRICKRFAPLTHLTGRRRQLLSPGGAKTSTLSFRQVSSGQASTLKVKTGRISSLLLRVRPRSQCLTGQVYKARFRVHVRV